MKKITTTFFALALLAAGMSSCQKDEQNSGMQFSATLEEASDMAKVDFDFESGLHWVNGDTIVVFGEGFELNASGTALARYSGGFFSATVQDDPSEAVFTEIPNFNVRPVVGLNRVFPTTPLSDDDAPFYAFYPVSYFNFMSAQSVLDQLLAGQEVVPFAIFPSQYTSPDGRLRGFPMFAKSETTNLRFKNLLGVIRLRLTANTSIRSIRISSPSEPMSGKGIIVIDNAGVPSLVFDESYNNGNSVTLRCTQNQNIANGHDFYVPVPAGSYQGLTFTFTNATGQTCVKTMNPNATVVVARSQYSTITLGPNDLVF